ncbi:DMT family transporter [Paenibacillus sp.]|uniref:DMT family transporter n=1 Tax=Paenibacillus sp. TaxID=58172 RepID=UPI002810BA1C|nr:DMT family transporter [Paenibacillus sp.]
MENYWIYLVIVASISHALWNIMLKQSENKAVFLWSLRIWSVIIFLPVSILFWPQGVTITYEWIFWGLGSIALHSAYAIILAKAYEKSDFSLAYPISRGLGPLLVVAAGSIWLSEPVTSLSVLGSLFIFVGIYMMYSGVSFSMGVRSLKSILKSPYPFLVGLFIACYTIFDKLAVAVIPPITLNVIENLGQVLVLGSLQVRNIAVAATQWKTEWVKMAVAGGLAGLSYILVLIVLTEVPVSFVAPVRESSIVIGSLLGVYFLKEKYNLYKIIGSVIIFAGVVMIVWK